MYFGFQKTLSTIIARRVVMFFACFIDFSKAFDYVDYWQRFCKLIDTDGCVKSVLISRRLANGYCYQLVLV